MTAVSDDATAPATAPALEVADLPLQRTAPLAVEPPAPPPGDPAMIGVPTFVVGALALGLALVGYLPATATGGILPVVIATTGLGQVVAALWAARIGASAVACVFGVFAGFWLSYGALLLGLTHGWYGIGEDDATRVVSAFLLVWSISVAVLALVTLRLPLAFTALFALVDLALVLVLLGNELGSTGLTRAGGVVVLAFAGLGVYLFAGAASVATGGPALPLGRPVQH